MNEEKELVEELNNVRNELKEYLIERYRETIESGEWNFYIIPERLGFIYIIEKSDDSDFKVLNKELVEEYGIY